MMGRENLLENNNGARVNLVFRCKYVNERINLGNLIESKQLSRKSYGLNAEPKEFSNHSVLENFALSQVTANLQSFSEGSRTHYRTFITCLANL